MMCTEDADLFMHCTKMRGTIEHITYPRDCTTENFGSENLF